MKSQKHLKLRRIRIGGYKALLSLDVKIPDKLLLLIGANGSGKSSLLQAIAFIQYFAKGRPLDFFIDRSWNPSEVRSRATKGRTAVIKFELLFDIDRKRQAIWEFSWGLVSRRSRTESVWFRPAPDQLPKQIFRYNRLQGPDQFIGDLPLRSLKATGSILASVEPSVLAVDNADVLERVIKWGVGVTFLDLLSPTAMRRGLIGSRDSIGFRGRNLAEFIAGLDPQQKHQLVQRLSRYYPVSEIDTTRKAAGWVDMRISERWRNIAGISAAHMSDGFLRLLALCAIPEFRDDVSTVLLDEAEDGIGPHVLPDLIGQISEETDAQLIMTSHSPLLVNFFPPEAVCLLARAQNGQTVAAKLSELDAFKLGSEYLGGGEIWASISKGSLADQVLKHASVGRKTDLHSLLSVEAACDFMDGR